MAPDRSVDLLVVGGGINGTGIARDAAGRGLSVLLCEKDDLAEHTSSASSKLIHGGLRYLEHYEFRLVREALIEREVLLKLAPHIVWGLRFILPHSPEQRPAWMIRLGLFIYDHLGGRDKLPGSARIDLRRDPTGEPLKAALKTAFSYADCWVDDARLVVLNAMDAAERGAEVLTRTRCTAARREGGLWHATLQGADGAPFTVQARALINAAGPWVSQVLSDVLAKPAQKSVRMVKGSHLVVPRLYEHDSPYILQHTDGRVVFVIPYEQNYSLIGTTDSDYGGDPADVEIEEDEVRYLCDAVSRYLKQRVEPEQVCWRYAGVRPLYDDATTDVSAATRDYAFDLDTCEGAAPLLSVFGGKITTYRKLAEHAMEKLQPHLGFAGRSWTDRQPLPGGDMEDADFERFLAELTARYSWLPRELVRRYARAYGTRTDKLLGEARALGELGEHLGDGLYEAEIDYLRQHEWAVTEQDILWRRSKLAMHIQPATAMRLRARLEGTGQAVRVGAGA